MDIAPVELRYYQTTSGKRPFQEWLDSLDTTLQDRRASSTCRRQETSIDGYREGFGILGGLLEEDAILKAPVKPSASYRDDLLLRLKDPEFAAGYLSKCLEDDEGAFLVALRDVAEAHGGIRQLARKTRLNREHLFRMLSKQGNPHLHSLRQLVGAVGLKLTLQPI